MRIAYYLIPTVLRILGIRLARAVQAPRPTTKKTASTWTWAGNRSCSSQSSFLRAMETKLVARRGMHGGETQAKDLELGVGGSNAKK